MKRASDGGGLSSFLETLPSLLVQASSEGGVDEAIS
jgi:hypothetical protein